MRAFFRRLVARFRAEPETCRVCGIENPDAPVTPELVELHADVQALGGPICSEDFCRIFKAMITPGPTHAEAVRAEHDPACLLN